MPRQAEEMDGNGIGGDPLLVISNRPTLAIRQSTKDTMRRCGISIPSIGYLDLDAVSAALTAHDATDTDRITVVTTLAACQLFDVAGAEDRLIRDRVRSGLAA